MARTGEAKGDKVTGRGLEQHSKGCGNVPRQSRGAQGVPPLQTHNASAASSLHQKLYNTCGELCNRF